MEETLLFAPTLETQHFNLVALCDACEELPLDIASHKVGRGRLKEAIRALEQGRALIHSPFPYYNYLWLGMLQSG